MNDQPFVPSRPNLSLVELAEAARSAIFGGGDLVAGVKTLVAENAELRERLQFTLGHDEWATRERDFFYTQMFVERDRAERAERERDQAIKKIAALRANVLRQCDNPDCPSDEDTCGCPPSTSP